MSRKESKNKWRQLGFMDFMYFSFDGFVKVKMKNNTYKQIYIYTGTMACYNFWDAVKRIKDLAKSRFIESELEEVQYFWVPEDKIHREPQIIR